MVCVYIEGESELCVLATSDRRHTLRRNLGRNLSPIIFLNGAYTCLLSFLWSFKAQSSLVWPTDTFIMHGPSQPNRQLAGPSARFQLISQSNSSELIANFPFQTARCWPVLKLSGLFGQKGRRSRRRSRSKWTRAQEVLERQSGERNEQNSISDWEALWN